MVWRRGWSGARRHLYKALEAAEVEPRGGLEPPEDRLLVVRHLRGRSTTQAAVQSHVTALEAVWRGVRAAAAQQELAARLRLGRGPVRSRLPAASSDTPGPLQGCYLSASWKSLLGTCLSCFVLGLSLLHSPLGLGRSRGGAFRHLLRSEPAGARHLALRVHVHFHGLTLLLQLLGGWEKAGRGAKGVAGEGRRAARDGRPVAWAARRACACVPQSWQTSTPSWATRFTDRHATQNVARGIVDPAPPDFFLGSLRRQQLSEWA
jgi:hypothetical protein